MIPKLLLAGTLAGLTAATAGCGSSSSSPKVDAAAAKAAIERAAHVRLASSPVTKDARDEGLEQAYSNQATASKDKQIVFLFTLKDSDTVNKLRDQLKGSVPGQAQLMTHNNLVVVYGSVGADHAAEIKSTINGLS